MLDSTSPTGFHRRVGKVTDQLMLLLRACLRGDHKAFDEIARVVSNELRQLATLHMMRGDESGHANSTTGLVSEACRRLADRANLDFRDRAHFLAIALRRTLVDHERRAAERASAEPPVELDETRIASGFNRMIALDEALDELAKFDHRKAQITQLHYFGGFTQAEIAAVCEVHVNTVARDLWLSTAWLRHRLAESH